MNNKKEWIDYFRSLMRETEVNDENYSDEEVLDFGKGMMVSQINEFKDLKYEWQYDLFFNSLINFIPVSKGLGKDVDVSLFKNRAEKQKN